MKVKVIKVPTPLVKVYLAHRGYTFTQYNNNHYIIVEDKTQRVVLHAHCTEELTVGLARECIDDYIRHSHGELKVVLDPGAWVPIRAHEDDAGLDLISPTYYTILPWEHAVIDTGVHVQIPEGYVGRVTSKSSLMDKGLITTATIDAGYTGSIKVVLFNVSRNTNHVDAGQKIAQLVIHPIITPEPVVVNELQKTERGDGGFGSTGAMAEEVTDRAEV